MWRVDRSFSGRVLRALASLAALAAVAAPRAAWPAAPEGFAQWLAQFRGEAEAAGVAPAVLDRSLAGLAPDPHVIELDQRQPETRLSTTDYLARVVSPQRVERTRSKLAENAPLLRDIARRYHVQPRFIVALWGIESDFGQSSGASSVLRSLATLAFDGRRSDYFRHELMQALRIVEAGDATPEQLRGSWAGAMGQCQFMPTSFLSYAVDWNGDGRRDIWTTRSDALASIAHYLSAVGWSDREGWGRAVRIPARFDRALIGRETIKPLSQWATLGVRAGDGGALPNAGLAASLIQPDGAGAQAYLIYGDFRTLLDWNRSNSFALAVGMIADRAGAG